MNDHKPHRHGWGIQYYTHGIKLFINIVDTYLYLDSIWYISGSTLNFKNLGNYGKNTVRSLANKVVIGSNVISWQVCM